MFFFLERSPQRRERWIRPETAKLQSVGTCLGNDQDSCDYFTMEQAIGSIGPACCDIMSHSFFLILLSLLSFLSYNSPSRFGFGLWIKLTGGFGAAYLIALALSRSPLQKFQTSCWNMVEMGQISG